MSDTLKPFDDVVIEVINKQSEDCDYCGSLCPTHFAAAAKEISQRHHEMRADALRSQLQQVTEERNSIKALYDAGCEQWNPVYKIVLDGRDQLRQQLAACEQERDALKDPCAAAGRHVCGPDSPVERFRSQLVEAVRAKADRRSAFYREAKVHDEVAEFIEQFPVKE